MENVAANRHNQPANTAFISADGECIQQRLRRVLMLAIARIDHRAIDFTGQKLHRACRMMAHNNQIGPHRVQRHGGIDQRLALFNGGRANRHVHHISAQPFACKFKRGLGARRGFKKQIDLGASPQGRLFLLDLARNFDSLIGQIQKLNNIFRRQTFDAKKVTMRKKPAGGGQICH